MTVETRPITVPAGTKKVSLEEAIRRVFSDSRVSACCFAQIIGLVREIGGNSRAKIISLNGDNVIFKLTDSLGGERGLIVGMNKHRFVIGELGGRHPHCRQGLNTFRENSEKKEFSFIDTKGSVINVGIREEGGIRRAVILRPEAPLALNPRASFR